MIQIVASYDLCVSMILAATKVSASPTISRLFVPRRSVQLLLLWLLLSSMLLMLSSVVVGRQAAKRELCETTTSGKRAACGCQSRPSALDKLVHLFASTFHLNGCCRCYCCCCCRCRCCLARQAFDNRSHARLDTCTWLSQEGYLKRSKQGISHN